jgi:hypothetical protein
MSAPTAGDWLDRLLTPDETAPAAHVVDDNMRSEPIRLSESLRHLALELLYELMADELDPDVLFELAWLKKYNSPSMVARRSLTDEGVEKLVDILANRHSVPTLGFWQRFGNAA